VSFSRPFSTIAREKSLAKIFAPVAEAKSRAYRPGPHPISMTLAREKKAHTEGQPG